MSRMSGQYLTNSFPVFLQKTKISVFKCERYPETIISMQIEHKQSSAVEQLVALTSSCLINEMRYYDSSDSRKEAILQRLKQVEESDPEFVLQLAVYLRKELGLRTTTNYIVAFCACSKVLSKYLPTYFENAVLLPSDAVQVMQFVQVLHLMQGGLSLPQIKKMNAKETFDIRRKLFVPNQLKKALTKKILKYSEYQLGKYCSDSNRKAVLQNYLAIKRGLVPYKVKLRKAREARELAKNKDAAIAKVTKKIYKGKHAKKAHCMMPGQAGEISKANAIEKTFLTMKDLISFLHIKPTLLTGAVLGIKYPKTAEEFQKKFPGEKFDPSNAGKRMKIKTPITWETELSSKGNTKETWENLLTNNRVPYLALLRNLSNIIKADVAGDLCIKVADFLSDKENVVKNRANPLQYLSAYQTLKAKKQVEKGDLSDQEFFVDLHPNQQQDNKKAALTQAQKQKVGILAKGVLTALQQSMCNVQKLKGVTAVFTDVSGSMRCPMSGGKSYGSVRTCADLSILLGIMINQNCDHCKYYIFSSVGSHQKCYLPVWDVIKQGTIFDKMQAISKQATKLGGGTDFPTEVIEQAIIDKQKIDNIIILSDMMISNDKESVTNGYVEAIQRYQKAVNPQLKVYSVDLRGYQDTLDPMSWLKEKTFTRIYGGNSSILKFISQTQSGQIEYIRNYHSTLQS